MSRLEVEKYTCAGESISYHDTTLGNQGGSLFRVPDNADAWDDAAASHAHDIDGTTDGEWLVYTVEITATVTYDLWVAAASSQSGSCFRVEIDGVDVTVQVAVPVTRGVGNGQKDGAVRPRGLTVTRLEPAQYVQMRYHNPKC